MGRWQQALLKELERNAQITPHHHLVSIFFGGGTPSLMAPEIVELLIKKSKQLWNINEPLEITLEANPGTVDVVKFQEFARVGVNRLSLGVQSFNDKDLTFLGRQHDAKQALKAIIMAKENFPRYSFDLIYALPDQNKEQWAAELKEALSYTKEHLSLYQLTIEKGTAFYAPHQRGELKIPEENTASKLYEMTEDIMMEAGLPAYEVSNYARPSAECRHNLVYWRYEDYVGIGPGAHGRITRSGQKFATQHIKAPEIWLEAVERQGSGLKQEDILSKEEQISEQVLMGLRLVEGLDEKRLNAEVGMNFEDIFSFERLKLLIQEGLLIQQDQILRTTLKGRLCLNSLVSFALN